jgi:hypothetical protein
MKGDVLRWVKKAPVCVARSQIWMSGVWRVLQWVSELSHNNKKKGREKGEEKRREEKETYG